MHKFRLTYVLFLAIALTACGSIPIQSSVGSAMAEPPSLDVGSIRFNGNLTTDGVVESYLGVPFAQAPVGNLRWMPPEPLTKNASTLDVTEFAPACMQGPHLANWYKDVIQSFGGNPDSFLKPKVSEDCLYLNIWKSRDRKNNSGVSTKPVFVFIHGGSNKGGWSYEPNYMGAQLARRGIVVVTIAYRVGAFGFFAHPELAQANFGLLDQIAALNWVKENIAGFGGDPNNVTLAGESAGANNIEYLMASPLAKGLFRRVAHQSGGSVLHERTNKQALEALGSALAERILGKNGEGEMQAMRGAPAEAIIHAAEKVYANHYFDPVVDGHSVLAPLAKSVASGELASVDLLIGANADEWTVYVEKGETIDSWLSENLPRVNATAVKSVLDNGESVTKQLDRLITGHYFVCPSLRLASANSQAGGKSWFYQFSRVRPGDLASTMGAYHGAELPYLFDTHDEWLPTNQQDRVVGEAVMSYWSNFAMTGNPNEIDTEQSTLPYWPEYEKKGDLIQNISTEIFSEVHSSQKLCELLMPSK